MCKKRKFKVMSILLVLLFIMQMVPAVSVSAATEYMDFKYLIENNEACITGYTGSDSEIEIPSEINETPVTSIAENAFEFCDAKRIIIPEGITQIGEGAFSGCFYLESLVIPEGVESIPGIMCYSCASLTSVTLPQSVTRIGDWAFLYCNSLEEINIPSGVTYIGENAFKDCRALKEVTLPQGITEIHESAFAWCESLANVTIPQGVTSIGSGAFVGCDQFTEIIIPDSVTFVGDNAFNYCSGVKYINIGAGLKSIDVWAFSCPNLERFEVSQENTAFASVDGVLYTNDFTELFTYPPKREGSEYTVPDGVTDIGFGSFADATSLVTINLPESVKNIDTAAFDGCTALENITLPAELKVLNNSIFDSCSSLENIVIPESVTDINYSAFARCRSLKELIIPESVRNIGEYAFVDCGFEKIVIPDGITAIRRSVFNGCEKLERVYLPESINRIDDYSFYDCDSLKTVYFAGSEEQWSKVSVEYSGNGSLFGAEIVFDSEPSLIDPTPSEPARKTVIDGVLYECQDGIATIVGCEDNRTSLTILPEVDGCTVKAIADYAFFGRKEITSVTIPYCMEFIGQSAFEGTSVRYVYYEENLICFNNINKAEGNEVLENAVVVSADYGDANSDGVLNVKDATFIQKALTDMLTLDEGQLLVADVNNNHRVNIKDVTLIQKLLAGFSLTELIR